MAGLGRACEKGVGGLVLIAWKNKALPLSQGFEANCFRRLRGTVGWVGCSAAMHQLGQSIGAFVQQVNILLHQEFCGKRKAKKVGQENEGEEGRLS